MSQEFLFLQGATVYIKKIIVHERPVAKTANGLLSFCLCGCYSVIGKLSAAVWSAQRKKAEILIQFH